MDRNKSHELLAMAAHSGEEGAPVRRWLRDARRRIVEAARRGATEAVVSGAAGSAAEMEAIRTALGAGGFAVTAVGGEDGPYVVVHW